MRVEMLHDHAVDALAAQAFQLVAQQGDAGGRAVRVRFGAASLCSGKTLWEKAVASSLLGGHMLMLMLMLVASLCSGKTLWEKAVASSHPRPMLMWRGSILATWAERVRWYWVG
jgi:hypothetical protein